MGGTFSKTDIGHGRGWLEVEAAKSQARIDRTLGHPQQITEAGRSWEQQNAHWLTFQKYGKPIALHPDTPSVHQKGRAKDTDERDVALMNDHGWFQTVYRTVNGRRTLVEPWHFEYFPERDKHRNDPAPSGGASDVQVPEEDDMPGPDKKLVLWNEQHYFLIGDESIYHVANGDWLPYLRDHYGPHGKEQNIDNGALTLELVANAIPWDAVDACMRGVAFGGDGRNWSRMQAEGVAIRGQQAASRKTIDDVLKTAIRIEQAR